MKKYIFGILVAISLTACGGQNSVETEGEQECKDTTCCTVDSVKIVKDTVK